MYAKQWQSIISLFASIIIIVISCVRWVFRSLVPSYFSKDINIHIGEWSGMPTWENTTQESFMDIYLVQKKHFVVDHIIFFLFFHCVPTGTRRRWSICSRIYLWVDVTFLILYVGNSKRGSCSGGTGQGVGTRYSLEVLRLREKAEDIQYPTL